MENIPFKAIRLAGETINDSPIAYGKVRVSGSDQASYILHSKGACLPGNQGIFSINSRSIPKGDEPIDKNKIIDSYKRENRQNSNVLVGDNYQENALSNFTYKKFSSWDDETYNIAIQTTYKQLFGNFLPMESERPIETERRLRNGDLSIREYIRIVAKTDFYRRNYFEHMNPIISIELNFKHLLGRPTLCKHEINHHVDIIIEYGYNAHIDSIIDCEEYDKVFGQDVIPYRRSLNSPLGMRSSTFELSLLQEKGFAISDNLIEPQELTTKILS